MSPSKRDGFTVTCARIFDLHIRRHSRHKRPKAATLSAGQIRCGRSGCQDNLRDRRPGTRSTGSGWGLGGRVLAHPGEGPVPDGPLRPGCRGSNGAPGQAARGGSGRVSRRRPLGSGRVAPAGRDDGRLGREPGRFSAGLRSSTSGPGPGLARVGHRSGSRPRMGRENPVVRDEVDPRAWGDYALAPAPLSGASNSLRANAAKRAVRDKATRRGTFGGAPADPRSAARELPKSRGSLSEWSRVE